MRALPVLALSLLGFTLVAAEPLSLHAPIRRVRLHPDEAWVTRVGRATVPGAGTHRLQLEGLLPGMKVEDLQVSAKCPAGTRLGDLSVAADVRVVSETADWKRLETEKDALRERRDNLEAQGEAVQQELTFLKGLQASYDKELSARLTLSAPNPAAVVELGRSLQARMADLMTGERRRKRDLEKISREELRLRAEMQKRSQEQRTAPSRVTVEVTTTTAGEVELELGYRTGRARWKPLYEARLAENRTRLDLLLLAAVTQNTGENWQGVRLEISNARPSRSLATPAFTEGQVVAWHREPPALPMADKSMAYAGVAGGAGGVGMPAMSNQMVPEVAPPPPPPPPPPMQEAEAPTSSVIEEATGLAATFLVDGLKEVPSDGEPHRFRVQVRELKPEMGVIASPRLETTAFLQARFPAPGGMPLFPSAPVVRFVGTQRLGEAPLELPAAGQPFALGFGPYKSVRVTFRQVDRKLEEVGTFTKERQWTLRERMEITNDGAEAIEVEVRDRILKSGGDPLKISLLPDFAPGWTEPLPGVRAWKVGLNAKESRTLELPLTIRAPREGIVNGLEEAEE